MICDSKRAWFPLLGPAVFAFALACGSDPAATIQNPGFELSAAKGTAADVTVTGAAPDSATQDTTLDVTIAGSGFVAGATATWALQGVVDPAQIRTNRTTFVTSRKLIANITISGAATVGKWDIVVTAGSKGGIGTEAFAVKSKPQGDINSRVNVVFDDAVNVAAPGQPLSVAPAGIQGDLRDRTGNPSTTSEYQGSFCGVNSKIFWSGTNFGGDLVFSPAGEYDRRVNCGAKRMLRFFLDYQPGTLGSPRVWSTFTNIRAIMYMESGEVRSHKTHFNYLGLADCDRLDFDETWSGAANVTTTRLPDVNGARKWRVESQYPHMAMCTVPKGFTWYARTLKYLPFAFTATEVPYPYPVHGQ